MICGGIFVGDILSKTHEGLEVVKMILQNGFIFPNFRSKTNVCVCKYVKWYMHKIYVYVNIIIYIEPI